MRTTININDQLFRQVKRAAIETHRTLTAVIEDALREVFFRKQQSQPKDKIELPVSKGGELRPGVNLDSNSDLLDLMEKDKFGSH